MDTGTVGDKHPDPENIRHGSINSPAPGSVGGPAPAAVGIVTPQLTKSTSATGSIQPSSGIASSAGSIPVGSPAKESGLQRETSAEDDPADEENKENNEAAQQQQGIPIRS